MLRREEKEKIVSSLKTEIDKAQAVFLTNIIGVTSNDANNVRKALRGVDGKVIIARNTLLKRAAAGTKCEKMLENVTGPSALAFAYKDPAAVAKALKDAGKELELISIRSGVLGTQFLGADQVKALADLPSRDQMLGTLLATFLAPVSAFARVMHAIKEEKEKNV